MKADIRLFPLNIRSASGTHIPENVFDEYINSERCKDALSRKIMTGGLTHLGRSMPDEYSNKIGIDDVQLLDGNVTHYITNLWRGTDGYVYATIETFNYELFDDNMAAFIKRLEGYLRSGVKLGVSVVVDSITDKNSGESTQLVSIIGVDMTYNPAFANTEVIKVYED